MPHSSDPDPHRERIAAAVTGYIRAGGPLSVADGPGVIGELEQRIDTVPGLPDPLAIASGTAAMHAAYLALDPPPGTEVIGQVATFQWQRTRGGPRTTGAWSSSCSARHGCWTGSTACPRTVRASSSCPCPTCTSASPAQRTPPPAPRVWPSSSWPHG